ncbi:MAG: hypothetical protein PGN23_16105 [Sphingomonas adhaesiva]
MVLTEKMREELQRARRTVARIQPSDADPLRDVLDRVEALLVRGDLPRR